MFPSSSECSQYKSHFENSSFKNKLIKYINKYILSRFFEIIIFKMNFNQNYSIML